MTTITRSLRMLIVMTIMTGVIYPLVITGIAMICFPVKSTGSLVYSQGRVIGSELIGQKFTFPGHFHGRPSFCDYSTLPSQGSNWGPGNSVYLSTLKQRAANYREENNLSSVQVLPPDAITFSASGLDPHISLENALLQVSRVATARGIPENKVKQILFVEAARDKAFFQKPVVNVMKLNVALDSVGGIY